MSIAMTEAAGPAIGAIGSDNRAAEKAERALLASIRAGNPDAPHEMKHIFLPGIYWREIKMFAGTICVGREHTTGHMNVVLEGKCQVEIDGEVKTFKTGDAFESAAGVRKTLFIVEDTRWATVHPNPNNVKDMDQLESMFTIRSPEEMEHRKAMLNSKEDQS